MSTVISVENVSKLYRLGEIGTGSLAHDVNRWWHKARGKEDPYLQVGIANDRTSLGTSEYVYAVKDVSFEVREGEVLGIIGRNGAGKSTLLKILSRVTTPTSGQIKVKGRIASLLEVGTGFHPELTGRENIFLNGAILGMRKKEVRGKFDEIVDFSGCERYIDTPVKRYSSGMYVRLAFAVAAHLEPEILIVDEVLAVGDAEFQKKCMGRMRAVANEGRTVIFVSHNMQAINNLCTSGINLENGRVSCAGSISQCIGEYLKSMTMTGSTWERPHASDSTSPIYFEKISSKLKGSQPIHTLELDCSLITGEKHKDAFCAVDILDDSGTGIMQAIPTIERVIKSGQTSCSIRIEIKLPPMVPGNYFATLWVGPHNDHTYDEVLCPVGFSVLESPTEGRTFPHHKNHGCIVPESKIIIL